ncbi:MAG TPA: hypothetical protein VE911_01135 [Candidatus Nitrosopolaris sp.]|nr:hypothetical protein [Candidatus Nitrosopolaris sp.]
MVHSPSPAGSSRRWAWHVGAATLFAVLAMAGQRRLVAGLRDHVFFQELPAGNDCLLHVWTLAWDHHALATHPAGVLDANIFYPYPSTLLYSDHLLGLAVLLAPLRLVTANPVLIHNLVTVAAPALDALALYALALALTGEPAAALVGALLYGFAPLRFTTDCCQVQMLAAWWLPLLFLFARRALARDSRRDGLVAGIVLALQGLTGIYLTAFVLPFLLVAHLFWLRRFPLGTHRRGWGALLLAELAALAVLVPVGLAYRGVQESLGVSRSVALNELLALHPEWIAEYFPVLSLGTLSVVGLLVRRGVPQPFGSQRGLLATIALGALLLAMGPAIPLPGGWGEVKGPYALLFALPGYDALRAPARMVHVGLLGAALLAAGGFATLARRLPLPQRHIAAGLVAACILLESWRPPVATIPAPPRDPDPVYTWLAGAHRSLHLVELPIDQYVSSSVYQYRTMAHWKRTLDGNMGLVPPLYPFMVHQLARFPDPDVVATLRALGITHALVHPKALAPRDRERIAALQQDPSSPIGVPFTSDDAVVLALGSRPLPASPTLRGHKLDRGGWKVHASHGAALAVYAIDASLRTSWRNWGDLEASLHAWYDPVPFLARWRQFLAGQPSRLEVDLGAPVPMTAAVVRLGGSDPMVAPALRFESSIDGASWTPLAGELTPLPDVRGLVDSAREARFALVLRATVPAQFLRLSVDGFDCHLGDLEVYAE